MKKNNKNMSGITLVALVVTIIVLLILAGITIATLFGDNGIINKAQKAKEETEKSSQKELDALNTLEGEMENAIKGNTSQDSGWRQPDPLKPEITNGEITLKIGDYVDYNCKSSTATYTSPASKSGYTVDQVFKANAYNYGWRVLGIDKNTKQLQLISEDFVQPTEGGSVLGVRQVYYLMGQSGYINGVEELNKICAIYGTGEGAIEARSVNVDDIDWITGYNPNNTGVRDQNKKGNGIKCNEGQLSEYGNDVKYTLTSTGVKYEPANSAESGTNTYRRFTYYDEASKIWKSLATNESVTLRSNSYYYYPTTLTETKGVSATTGISSTSAEYNMLFTNSSTGADTSNKGNSNYFKFWLSSTYFDTDDRTCYAVGLRGVFGNGGSSTIGTCRLYNSDEGSGGNKLGVRPVVTLDSKVTLKDSGTMQDGCKLYNMSVNK